MIDPRLSDDLDETFDHAVDDASDVVDHVAEEFAERCRRGESPSIDEYVRRYPEHAGKIRDLLPSVLMMESLKRQVRASAGAGGEPPEPIPERLGEYRIVREIGRGGMGVVYEAYQESLGRHVALKVIPQHVLLDPRRRRRFQREAMAVAQLHHTNIVPIFAAGEHDGLPYYAMQYIRGDGLDRRLDAWRRDGLVPGREHWMFVARVGVQAADAIQYAHDQGILHRDIKPANILIDEHQVAWITDFGLAKLAGREDLTHSGDVVGTLRYLAPEALGGKADHRGDIYSLGLTLYELLTLRPPFGELSPSALLRCVTEEQPTRPRKLDRSIPIDLETIVLKATAREPAHRYATAAEMAEDLRAFLADRPIRARRASMPQRLARWGRRNKGLAAAMAAVAASMLIALGASIWGLVAESRARDQAEANVRFSLAYFDELFKQLSDPSDEGPFADGRAPEDRGRSGPPRTEASGRHPDRFDPGMPPPRDRDSRPHAGPGPPLAGVLSPKELGVLETVLRFYDGFAERNATNSQLEGEAARAYRKVAWLYRWLGRETQADAAHARALARFEALVRRHGDDPDYAYDLARTLAMDDLGSPAVPSRADEPGLRRAIAIVDRLFERATEKKRITYAAALARWETWLAERLDRGGRGEQAIAAYRASIARDEWLGEHLDEPAIVHGVLASRRAALAEVLIRLGRRDEARPVLDRASAEIGEVIGEEDRPLRGAGRGLADCLESLAGSYRGLGDPERAVRMEQLAGRVRERARQGRPGRHGGGFGGPRRAQAEPAPSAEPPRP